MALNDEFYQEIRERLKFDLDFTSWLKSRAEVDPPRLLLSDIGSLSPERWHEIGAAGEPAFQNAWVNFGAGASTAAFFRDPFGVVHLKGLIKSGAIGALVFTLPAGYLPPLSLNIATVSNPGAALASRLQVSNVGNVIVAEGNNAGFLLDGITFRTS